MNNRTKDIIYKICSALYAIAVIGFAIFLTYICVDLFLTDKDRSEDTTNSIFDMADYFYLIEVERYENNVIYYDVNTGVMYYVYNEGKNNSWCTPIYDTDGLPKLYDGGDIDYAEKRNELQSGDR